MFDDERHSRVDTQARVALTRRDCCDPTRCIRCVGPYMSIGFDMQMLIVISPIRNIQYFLPSVCLCG